MNFFKTILLTCLTFFQYKNYYASSKYKDSVFSVCFLRFKEPLRTKLNPKRTSINTFIAKLMKEKDLLNLPMGYGNSYEGRHLLTFRVGTAFYIGNGRFVTNFHLIVRDNPKNGRGVLFIQYKDKIIHIEENLQHDSVSDLLVLYSDSKDTKDLLPLKIDIPKMHTYGDMISLVEHKYNANIDIKNVNIDIEVSKDSFLLKRNEKIILFIPNVKIKPGMSGSPLLYKDKVIGVLFSFFYNEKLVFFTSSTNLLKLLDTIKFTCDTEKCMESGVDHLISEAKDGSLNAQQILEIYLHSNDYVEKKFLESFEKKKTFSIFRYAWKIFRNFKDHLNHN